jgi:3-deoxy-D-manno-octulosonic-acid transferase
MNRFTQKITYLRLVYDLTMGLYGGLVCVAAWLGHPKAMALVVGRKETRQRLALLAQSKAGSPPPTVWFHAASAGELEQAKPLMQAWRALHPQDRIVLSVYSPSAYRPGQNPAPADLCFMMLADQPDQAAFWVQILQPYRVFFVKYEYWYHHIRAVQRLNIPLVMVCARMDENVGVLRPWFRPLWLEMARDMTLFTVQDPVTLNLFTALGLQRVHWVGDTRYDRVLELSKTPFEDLVLEAFTESTSPERASRPVLVAGSTWVADHRLLVQTLEAQRLLASNNKTALSWKLLLVPHEWNESYRASLLQTLKTKGPEFKFVFYSTASKDPSQLAAVKEADIMVVDQTGLLSRIYRLGKAAWIGGGFGAGIHNSLEAAVYGLPVAFGPRYQSFPEAVTLVEDRMAFPINAQGKQGLLALLAFLHKAGAYTPDLHQQIKDRIAAESGAVQRILDLTDKIKP